MYEQIIYFEVRALTNSNRLRASVNSDTCNFFPCVSCSVMIRSFIFCPARTYVIVIFFYSISSFYYFITSCRTSLLQNGQHFGLVSKWSLVHISTRRPAVVIKIFVLYFPQSLRVNFGPLPFPSKSFTILYSTVYNLRNLKFFKQK